MNLGDRLRGVVRSGASASQEPQANPASAPGSPWTSGVAESTPAEGVARGAADALGGERRESRGHAYVAIDRSYPLGHRLGRMSIGDCLPSGDGLWPRLPLLMANAMDATAACRRLLFVDLETTGLAGGAGTYAFLVGCGWFEESSFRVRQFFLTGYAAERVLLEEVAATAGRAGALVTYNGKTFDLPLIDTRFLFHRMSPPFGAMPHLDMLHHARRLWRPPASPYDEGGEGNAPCRLSAVEEAVLGHVREGDVPGFEIPSRYFHYVRTGDARPLEAVLEHNRLDLLALAMLTATAAMLLRDGPEAARTAQEAMGLGRMYERGGLVEEARSCFARAAHLPGNSLTHASALWAYGVSCRRAGRFDEAANAWERILAIRGCPARIAKDATEALAVHHEHRLRDLRAARRFAVQSLQFTVSTARVQAARHRLARLDRKLGERPIEPTSLFR